MLNKQTSTFSRKKTTKTIDKKSKSNVNVLATDTLSGASTRIPPVHPEYTKKVNNRTLRKGRASANKDKSKEPDKPQPIPIPLTEKERKELEEDEKFNEDIENYRRQIKVKEMIE